MDSYGYPTEMDVSNRILQRQPILLDKAEVASAAAYPLLEEQVHTDDTHLKISNSNWSRALTRF